MAGECLRLACEGDKDLLRHVLSEMGVSAHPTQGGRVDAREMSPYNLGKCSLRAISGVAAQKFSIVHHVYGTRR